MSRRSIEYFIELSINQMRKNLHRQITLEDLARTAMLSRYHFCRTFRRVTGISPTQFLSALRMEEAKNLLGMTHLSVTEISVRVGYSSMSAFCTRFAACVGVTPTMYRRTPNSPAPIPTHHTGPSASPFPAATVRGSILLPAGAQITGPIFAGLFPERIAQGLPLRHVMLERHGHFELTQVPCGRWHLLCHAETEEPGRPAGARLMAALGPITIRPTTTTTVSIRLRPAVPTDPPALLALPRPTHAGAPTSAPPRADYASL